MYPVALQHSKTYAPTSWGAFGPNFLTIRLQTAGAPPSAPTNPAATAQTFSTIQVTWDDVTGETGYRVERSDDGSTGWTDVSGNLDSGTTSYLDDGLDAETQYFYRVVAFNTDGDSDPSSIVNDTTPGILVGSW